jgi:hypothetical protein
MTLAMRNGFLEPKQFVCFTPVQKKRQWILLKNLYKKCLINIPCGFSNDLTWNLVNDFKNMELVLYAVLIQSCKTLAALAHHLIQINVFERHVSNYHSHACTSQTWSLQGGNLYKYIYMWRLKEEFWSQRNVKSRETEKCGHGFHMDWKTKSDCCGEGQQQIARPDREVHIITAQNLATCLCWQG